MGARLLDRHDVLRAKKIARKYYGEMMRMRDLLDGTQPAWDRFFVSADRFLCRLERYHEMRDEVYGTQAD